MTEPSNAPALPSSLAEGAMIADKYRVAGVIGQGGMGVVLKAIHVQLEREVAIKVVKRDLAEVDEVVARMLLEARAAASIKSEHVARVLDVARLDDGTPYIVMEYLEGQDLYDLLGERVQLGVGEAVDFVLQACEALAEAHAAGIVHRDLKPENLFLHRTRDGSELVKVLDFGISKTTAASGGRRTQMALTNPHGVVGSVHYMAPEQMRARSDVDARADIYALGSILFELLSGAPPFDGESVPEVCSMVLSDRPARLVEIRPDVPPGLDAAIQRCLEKDRDQRFANVAELADEIAPFGTDAARRSAGRISRVLLGRPSRVTGADGTGAFAAAQTLASREATTLRAPPAARNNPRLWWIVGAAGAALAVGAAVVYGASRRGAPAPAPDAPPPIASAAAARVVPVAPPEPPPDVTPAAPSAAPVDSAPDQHPLPHPAARALARPGKPKATVAPDDVSAFGGRR